MSWRPYDGDSVAKVISAAETQFGVGPTRFIADAGCRGYKVPSNDRLKVRTQGRSGA
jgi:hypothetical protein